MKILKVVKKDEKNVAIYLDNNEALFLSNEILIKNGLRKNDEISEDRFAYLIKENQLFYLKQKAFKLLGRRLHSVRELKIKLSQKGYETQNIDTVVSELIHSGYLNDYEFAFQFSEENIKNKLWGANKISAELKKRGIDRDIISRVLNEKFPSGNSSRNAAQLVEKKMKSISGKNIEPQKLKVKLLSFLASRGYDYETSKNVVEKYFGDDD